MMEKYREMLYKPVLWLAVAQVEGITLYFGHTCWAIIPAPGKYVVMGLLAAFSIAIVVMTYMDHALAQALLCVYVVILFWVGMILIPFFISMPPLGHYKILIWFGSGVLLLLWGLSWWVLKSRKKVKRKQPRTQPVPRGGKGHRILYTTVLYLTIAQIVWLMVSFVLVLWRKAASDKDIDGAMAFMTMIIFIAAIVALIWKSLRERAGAAKLAQVFLSLALFIICLVSLMSSSARTSILDDGTGYAVVFFLLLPAWWAFSLVVLWRSPAKEEVLAYPGPEFLSRFRVRLYKPVLYISLWQVLIINSLGIWIIADSASWPWPAWLVVVAGAVVIATVLVIAGVRKRNSNALNILQVYHLCLIFADIWVFAFAIVSDTGESLVLLLSLLLMLIWLFFLWVLQTPPQKIVAPAVGNHEEDSSPAQDIL